MAVEDDERLDLVFAALANRRRRQIVSTLALRPASIAQVAEEQGSSLPAIHRHIVALEEAGLIHRRKSGRINFLALTREGLDLARRWLGGFHTYWGSDDETLDNYISAMKEADQ